VGIDVVLTRVRALGGSVEISSEAGTGTSVTLRLPVSLAIVRALLARVDGEMYAVPMTHVRETVELRQAARRRVQGRDVMLLRDEVVPLLQFREIVGLPEAAFVSADGSTQVIVIECDGRRTGLVVDEFAGEQDIVVKGFDSVRDGLALFSGATILADGAPALIVDVSSLN
jgi:two-component system chemotaxis sensor kinase CheA